MGVAGPGVGVGGGGVGFAALAGLVVEPNATTTRMISADSDTDFFNILSPFHIKRVGLHSLLHLSESESTNFAGYINFHDVLAKISYSVNSTGAIRLGYSALVKCFTASELACKSRAASSRKIK